MKKYLKCIIACLFIASAYNLLLRPYHLIPTGLIGLSSLFSLTYDYQPAIFITLTNMLLLLIALPTIGLKHTNKFLLTSFLIPLFIYITRNINFIIKINTMENIILALIGSIIIGISYSIIYKEGLSIGGFEIAAEIFNKTNINNNKFISYFIDITVIIITLISLGLESAVYNTIITFIIIYLSTKAKFNINNNKTFFIITTKEKEVKNYLLEELKYDFTEFNIKGGFTNQKNKIIMTVIDTKDYYRLKEGISLIDSKAFISVIDNYESINKNITISENS